MLGTDHDSSFRLVSTDPLAVRDLETARVFCSGRAAVVG